MRRHQVARVTVALAVALAIAPLSHCAPIPSAPPPLLLPQTAVFTIVSACVNNSSFTDATSFQVTNGSIIVSSPGASSDLDAPLTRLSTCLERYPVDAGFTERPRPAYLLQVYDYELNVLSPCLKSRGYVVEAPPTRAEYLAGVYWTAYQSVERMNLDDYVALATACPPKPTYLRGGG